MNKKKNERLQAMNITTQLKEVLADLPEGVRLVAVSKFHPASAIQEAYDAGQRIFGESREQELSVKQPALPQDIEWHFIGHLQTNKVKYIAPYIAMIHEVDTFRLLAEIDKQAAKAGRVIPCLLEIHIAQEDSKYGFTFDSCRKMLLEEPWRSLQHIRIAGVMGMATNTDDSAEVQKEFAALKQFFDELKERFFADDPNFREISMGMSHDYLLAVAEGSTLVRVGSKIFGERIY